LRPRARGEKVETAERAPGRQSPGERDGSSRVDFGFEFAANRITLPAPMENIVYFDLETKKSFDEVGGRSKMRYLGVSVGVTYSTASGEYQIYGENRVNDLIEELRRADLVVGYNIIGFDFPVLQGENEFFDFEQVPSLDMMLEIQKQAEFRPSLDSVANACLGIEKTAEGLQAVKWYREGKLLEIAEYCCYDVKITKLVHEYGRHHKQVQFTNRAGALLSAEVDW
jgi:uncharacterized protein YprB with RNaseH-like and TPR domain